MGRLPDRREVAGEPTQRTGLSLAARSILSLFANGRGGFEEFISLAGVRIHECALEAEAASAGQPVVLEARLIAECDLAIGSDHDVEVRAVPEKRAVGACDEVGRTGDVVGACIGFGSDPGGELAEARVDVGKRIAWQVTRRRRAR